MLALIFLFQIIVFCNCSEKFDPTKVNYCELSCGRDENSACHCSKTPYREEVLDNIVEFRKAVLDKHNELRELVASGKETRSGLTSAADMQALSYSLELEYISRCLARNSYIAEHDKCRMMSTGIKAGQNLAFRSNDEGLPGHIKAIKDWYEEVTNLPSSPSTVEKFSGGGGQKLGHFTQVIWATMGQLGCVRFYTSKPKKVLSRAKQKFPYSLICNYAPSGEIKGGLPNMLGSPIYKRGEPCSACRVGKCDNPEYPSLCGKIEPVPTDPPYDIPDSGATRIFSTVTTCRLYFSLLISLICLYCHN